MTIAQERTKAQRGRDYCEKCGELLMLHSLEIKDIRGAVTVDHRTVVQGTICENGHESDIWGRLRT